MRKELTYNKFYITFMFYNTAWYFPWIEIYRYFMQQFLRYGYFA